MPEILLIICISLVSIVLIGLIIVGVAVYKLSKKSPVVGGDNSESFGEVKAKIDSVDRNVEKSMQIVMNKQMAELQKEFAESTQKSTKSLNDFQAQLNEYLQKRIDALNKQMDDKIIALDKKVDARLEEGFKNTNESMAQVRERLKTIDEAQKNMDSLGKEMLSIKNVLEGNQTRGRYGEYQLSMVLNNVFGDTPNCYEEQYTMKKVKDGNDVRADAVVFMPEPNKMIAIDSKFPFADYARLFDTDSKEERESLKSGFAAAVKKHITAIKDKYIVPNKTAPEAFMFIPNDGVFGFIHHDLPEVVDYARSQRVIITSPSTLPAMLVTINMVRIDAERAKNAKIISQQLNRLGKDFELFGKEWTSLSDRLALVSKARGALDSRVDKITGRFSSIAGVEELEDHSEDNVKEITIEDEE